MDHFGDGRIALYRAKAEEARREADACTQPELRQQLLDVARQYEALIALVRRNSLH